MKKLLLLIILILTTSFILVACNIVNTTNSGIKGTNLDFKIEVNDGNITETITLYFDSKKYSSNSELNVDKTNTLQYFVSDTKFYLDNFKRLTQQSSDLSDYIKEEYTYRMPINYESKNINNNNSIQFEMFYKHSKMRQVWYLFIQSYDYEANTGLILDYNDPLILGNPTNEADVNIQNKTGTWFNKQYILTNSVFDYAFIPYPTFKENFVDVKNEVVYTQTIISEYDSLKTNAIKEVRFHNLIVRTWVVDLSKDNPIEYYILEANRISWYVLALCITFIFVITMFVIYIVKRINKRRQNNINYF